MKVSNPQMRFVNLFTEYSLTETPGIVVCPVGGSYPLAIPTFNVIRDTFVNLNISVNAQKGAGNGSTQWWIVQTGGTGDIRYHNTQILIANLPRPELHWPNHIAAQWRREQGNWFLRADSGGSIDLGVYCWTNGSIETIPAGDLSVELFIFL